MPEQEQFKEAAREIDAIILMIDYLRRQVADLEPSAGALSDALVEAESCALLYRRRHSPRNGKSIRRRGDS